MEKSAKKVLVLTTKWGHLSIARAVYDALDNSSCQAVVEQIAVEKLSDHSYTTVYRLFPHMWKVPFRLAEKERIGKLTKKYLKHTYRKKVAELIKLHEPDIVINTYFGLNPVLEMYAEKGLPVFNIVANPRTFSKLELSNKLVNLLFDSKAIKDAVKLGIAKQKCVQAGWFVRKEFQESYNKIEIRKSLKMNSAVFTVCIVGGSDGIYSILKVLPAFIKSPEPVQVVFVAGNNTQLLRAVNGFKKLAESETNHKTTLIPIGFTHELDLYLKASDLVVGKAGPNLLFETAATHTPFFAVTHITGQEDGNLEILKKLKLGIVEENPVKAVRLIRHILKKPSYLNRFTKSVDKMSSYNKLAAAKLVSLLEEERDN